MSIYRNNYRYYEINNSEYRDDCGRCNGNGNGNGNGHRHDDDDIVLVDVHVEVPNKHRRNNYNNYYY